MDIANQLEKLSQPLNRVDESLVKLNQTVEQLAATMGVVQDEQLSKGKEFIKNTKKLSEIDRLIQVRQQKFDKQKLSFDLKNFKVFKDINLKFNKGMALTTAKVQKFGMDMAKTGKEFVVGLPKKILKGFLSIPGMIFRGIGSVLRKGFSNVFGTLGKSVSGIFRKVVPLAGVLAVPSLIIRQLMKVDEAMASIAQNTGLFGKNLKMVQQNTIDAASGLYAFGINLEDVSKQSSALVDSLGSASLVTDKLIENTAMIAKATGMSAQEAANLSAALIKGFGKTDEQVKSFTENMMNFASSSGVNARKVMRDIANDSNLTSIYLARGENYLANSAILAAKMGKSMAEQNQTLDAFADIETSIQNVEKINKLTGSNLNAQKMQMMFMTQDVQGLFGELNKAFSTPLAKARLQAMPGAFKEIAGALNLSIKDLREMPRVMREFAKASAPATKEQVTIEKAISDATTTIDKLKNIFFQFVLPAFNNLGEFLVNKIKPSIEGIVQSASDFGKELNKAMDADDTFLGKVKTAFRMILRGLQPTLIELFNVIRPHLEEMVDSIVHRFRSGLGPFGRLIFGGNEVDIEPVAGDVYQTNKSHRMMGGAAKGRVVDSASLFMVGEEGRSEVIIPTERIRKGLPVDPAVAKELASIGVPGFSMGSVRVSADAAAAAANTFQLNQQRRTLLYSQGDPEAVRKTESKIEEQSAIIQKQQRKIINEIQKARTDADRAAYFSGNPGGSPFAPPADGGGDRGRRRRGFDFHDAANTLNNFMMLTGTTFGDFFNMLPNVIEKPIEAAFKMLPGAIRTGLESGTQAAWNAYIKTGNFEAALKTGVITGLQSGGEKAKGGILGQTALLGAEFMRTGDLRGAAATTLSTSMRDRESFFGSAYLGAGDRIARQQELSSISEEDFYLQLAEQQENLNAQYEPSIKAANKNIETLKENKLKNDQILAAEATNAKNRFAEIEQSIEYQQNDSYRAMALRDRQKEILDYEQKTKELERAHVESMNKEQTKLSEITTAKGKAEDKLNKTQADAIEEFDNNTKLSTKMLKQAAKDQAMMGGMEGVLEALQSGEGLAGAAKTGLSRAAGGAAQGAITAGLTASGVPAPVASMIGQFAGGKVGKLAGKALGFLGLGGKNVKPKNSALKISDIITEGLSRSTAPGNQLVDFFRTGGVAHGIIKANIALASQDPEELIRPVQASLRSTSGKSFSRDQTLGFIQLLYGNNLPPGMSRDQALMAFEGELEGRAPMRRGETGAIVSRPTVALIGEAGPEAVVPLENSPGSRPLNGAMGDNGELLQEIKRMNQMLGAMANRPITLDGQKVNAVLNTVNSDDIRAGIYTVNSR